jgi:hypothetical protein
MDELYQMTVPQLVELQKKLIDRLEEIQKETQDILDKNTNLPTNEILPENYGDFIPLVWMIENLRRREGGCTMNELCIEAKKNFSGIEQIKHRTVNYKFKTK